MKTIVIANQKGGSGKTTLTRNLAVAAIQQNKNAILADLDPQGSLSNWWNRRADDSLSILKQDHFFDVFEKLQEADIDYLFVDTAPRVHEFTERVIKSADFVLIPVMPSPDDIIAALDTVAIAKKEKKPFIFVLNRVKPRIKLAEFAIEELIKQGTIANVQISDRIEYAMASARGLSILESAKSSIGADEIKKLFRFILRQMRAHEKASVEQKN